MSNDSSQVESVNATQAVEDEQKETYSATRWVITGILWFLVGLPGLMSILGFIGGSWWMNTLANFRTQYVLHLLASAACKSECVASSRTVSFRFILAAVGVTMFHLRRSAFDTFSLL